MDVFGLRDQVIQDYADYVRSFVRIRDGRINEFVQTSLQAEVLWPQPLIQMNPSFEPGGWVDELVDEGLLHGECRNIFRVKSEANPTGSAMLLHRHQVEAIRAARQKANYVLTTGTGSGKSLAYIVPVVDHVLRRGRGRGIQAIVVYPMNALCNSQYGELEKFLRIGYGTGNEPVRFDRYTGQEGLEKREEIAANPPDILLTNYVMLELILTRPFEKRMVNAARGLSFLVLDELHTYRGRQGADVALLVRRVREACRADEMLCIGTSATMATEGTFADQQIEIASVATRLFGAEVKPEHVIGETLTRASEECDFSDGDSVAKLRQAIEKSGPIPRVYEEFVRSSMASWLESTFGLNRDETTGRLVRATPRAIVGPEGAASRLSELTGTDLARSEDAIRRWLLAGYDCDEHPETKSRPFAFRLHQFVNRGDMVYASLEEPETRHLSLSGQQYVPGTQREKTLLPLVFCRECGAEYYCVWKWTDPAAGRVVFKGRNLQDRVDNDEDGEAGFLYRDPANPWPDDPADQIDRLPEDWLEVAGEKTRIRGSLRDEQPSPVKLKANGSVDSSGLTFWYTHTPFRFCQNCGVSYRARRGDSDFGRLATLSSGGRSTATTIIAVSSLRFLRCEANLQEYAKKLLSFTDNRQDASLQAGHFNDFVEVSLLRAALYKAARAAGDEGLHHDELAQKVFRALELSLELYAREPGVQFAQKTDTERAMRNVVGYRIYRDLKHGWRINSPNLEQCGLLRIEYESLDKLCREESFWQDCHPALVMASPDTRLRIARTLLDFLRRDLAIDVHYLTDEFHDRLKQQSSQMLREPWSVDEQERLEQAAAVFPRGRQAGDSRYFTYLSGRSGFGLYLSRMGTLPEFQTTGQRLRLIDKDTICQGLFQVLCDAGFVVKAVEPAEEDGIPGYRLAASVMRWVADDGMVAFHDPIRVPNPPEEGGRTNQFFVDFYRNVAGECRGMEAREHTAQVPSDERQRREKAFGDAKLPLLFCSPTMELGVDIRQLNMVNMRNVPPTPANYAQRSGRAGRSGQPALVITYCTTGNSHDQYFFRRSERMVSGSVTPPRLDLANEDLIRAHVQAVWLAETGQSLGNSLTDLLDVEGLKPSLQLLPSVRDGLSSEHAVLSAGRKASRILATVSDELADAPWYKEGWLDQVLGQTLRSFEDSCERWRNLFQAAKDQFNRQNDIIGDVARRHEWEDAKRLRREAEAQMDLLTKAENVIQSDFYSYRYFASEGFLPGYNFPRLPLSAFIPGRRRMKGYDEFLSRPRFLAVSEFGPRSIIYHEGSRYIVSKVILPVAEGDEPITGSAKQCRDCGYVRPLRQGEAGPDRCENCDSLNLELIHQLLRLQNVSTKRRDRISSDEEERMRMGYELRTGFRFQEAGGLPDHQVGEVLADGHVVFNATYASAATIWRVNLGWSRRGNREQYGFVLDTEKGVWARNDQLPDEDDPGDPMGQHVLRVVPFVQDRRNSLILKPTTRLEEAVHATLQAALKNAIQVVFQLEDNELAAEPLPSADDRRHILLYEAAEGGAGALRRLLDDPNALATVARQALAICHFDPETGEDLRRAEGATEDCEAACYDCLMTYSNQRDHELLDRHLIKDLLLDLCRCCVQTSPSAKSFAEHLAMLKDHCETELERAWLDHVVSRGLHLPTDAQKSFGKIGSRPDFYYAKHHTAIYIDGPVHDFPDRQQRDEAVGENMEAAGITVLRFGHQDDWDAIMARFPNVFGTPRTDRPGTAASEQATDGTET